MGHNAKDPGQSISRNGQRALRATGSTRPMPRMTNAVAKHAPIPAYAAAAIRTNVAETMIAFKRFPISAAPPHPAATAHDRTMRATSSV
jgi:hypothetical protein